MNFDFGAGAAMSNILIAVSLVFALIYLHAIRRGRRKTRTDDDVGPHDDAYTSVPQPRRVRGRHEGGLGSTAIGVGILAVMLFPIYWMLNVSLQQSGDAVGTPWLPLHITLHGYSQALHQQGHYLLTSLEIAVGSVIFSLLVAAPGAYALAHFRIRRAGVVVAILVSQMVPGMCR